MVIQDFIVAGDDDHNDMGDHNSMEDHSSM